MENNTIESQQAEASAVENVSNSPGLPENRSQSNMPTIDTLDKLKPYNIQGEDGTVLLDVIDELRSFSTIRQEVSLPEIVVVGMQSMGKSSVLKAISGIPFPIDQGGCTRFATELILRRSERVSQTVTIHAAHSSPAKIEDIELFQEKYKDFDLKDLADIIKEAKNVMNIGSESKCSDDVLRIECTGPKQDHLTLVDLPGLYSVTSGNSNSDDPNLVKSLVKKYLDRPRTIILPIISGSCDYEIQDILQELKSVDQSSDRSLGIITAPDMVGEGTARERAFLALAANETIKLRLGWHVLRNLGAKEKDPTLSRDICEKNFFADSPTWQNIAPDKRGIDALRKRLRVLLMEHISTQMDSILSNIDDTISRCKSDLERLGEERSQPDQQREFLVKVGKDFERLTGSALEGEYRDSYFDEPLHRLRAIIRNANSVYAKTMFARAHKWQLEGMKEWAPAFPLTDPNTFSHLRVSDPTTIEESQLIDLVFSMYRSHLGHELPGTFQPALVGKLFREQSYQWEAITRNHTFFVFSLVRDFLNTLVAKVMKDANSRPMFFHIINPALEERKAKLDAKVTELLKPYISGHPMTLNVRYTVSYPEMAEDSDEDSDGHSGEGSEEDAEDTTHTSGNRNDPEYVSCLHVIKVMQAYYDIAIGVLLDNIAALAIEQCLLEGLDQLISPTSIVKESHTRLSLLASESPEATASRQQLTRRLTEFEKGRATIMRHIGQNLNISGGLSETTDLALRVAVANLSDAGNVFSKVSNQLVSSDCSFLAPVDHQTSKSRPKSPSGTAEVAETAPIITTEAESNPVGGNSSKNQGKIDSVNPGRGFFGGFGGFGTNFYREPYSHPLSASYEKLPPVFNPTLMQQAVDGFSFSKSKPAASPNPSEVFKCAGVCMAHGEGAVVARNLKSFEEMHLEDWNQIHSEPARQLIVGFKVRANKHDTYLLSWREYKFYFEMCYIIRKSLRESLASYFSS